MEREKYYERFNTGSELKTIFYFSLPILVGNLFQQLYNVADSVIVGNFLGKESLAAVGFSYQINFLLIALVIFTIIRIINKFRRKKEESIPEPAAVEPYAAGEKGG